MPARIRNFFVGDQERNRFISFLMKLHLTERSGVPGTFFEKVKAELSDNVHGRITAEHAGSDKTFLPH